MSLGCGVQASLGMRYVCQPWFKVFGWSFVVSCGEFSVCNLWKSLLHIQLNIKEWYMYMYIILINLVQVPYCNLQTKFCPFRFIALMHQKSKPLPPPLKKIKNWGWASMLILNWTFQNASLQSKFSKHFCQKLHCRSILNTIWKSGISTILG